MNQAELIDALAQAAGVKKKEARSVLDSLASIGHAELIAGGEISLPGLGKLSTKERRARTAHNPNTGEAVAVPAKTVPYFSAAKALKDAVA